MLVAMVARIAPHETGWVLPTFVVGHEVAGASVEAPAWLVEIQQQAGGYAMSYPTVVGAVLRVEANLERISEGTSLLRGLQAMAGDPYWGATETAFLGPLGGVGDLWGTRGEPYGLAQLLRWDRILRAHLPLPPLASGLEAFLRFAPADALALFDGWRMFSCRVTGAAARLPVLDEAPTFYDDDVQVDDERWFDRAVLDELVVLGRAIGAPGGPRIFLLWENCD
jgi:hypothetical protein